MTNKSDSFLRRCRRQVRLTLDRMADWYLKVDTLSGTWTSIPRPGESGHEAWLAAGERQYLPEKPSRYGDSNPNIPVSWLALRTFVDRTEQSPDDIFYDIGCGSGRVLCYVARTRVAKCIGVELSQDFAAKALANAKSLRSRISSVEIMVGDAADMDYSRGTVFFLANPFGSETLRRVLARIEQTLIIAPREIRFIYVNPVHREVFNSAGWLKYAGERKLIYSEQRAEYWAHGP